MRTDRRELFIAAYLKDPNATRAAITAGYSEKAAHVTGCRLLKDAKVAAAIAQGQQQVAALAGIDAAGVVKRQLAIHDRMTVKDDAASVEVARKCLRDIGEHLGMYVERVESTNTNVSYVVEAPAKFDNPEWQQRYSQLQ